MTNTLENLIIDRESTLQRWPQVQFLKPSSLNLVCDASTAFKSTLPNIISEAFVASATIYFNHRINDFDTYVPEPIHIKTLNNNFSELAAISVGIENLKWSGLRDPTEHEFLNIFTDSIICMRKLRPIFAQIQGLVLQGIIDPMQILQSFNSYPLDELEYSIVYNLSDSGMIPSIYHIKGHVNNMNFIAKDFFHHNGIVGDFKELMYISSIHSMVDSLTIKSNQNMM